MKYMKFVGMSLLVAASTQYSAVALTWSGNGHDYEAVLANPGITWGEAEAAVPAGWYLATLTSAEENAWVYDNLVAPIESQYPRTDGPQLWLGGKVAFQGDTALVEWVTGEVSNYTNWGPGEPNNAGQLEFGPITINRFNDGTWNDEGAWMQNVQGYIIERNKVPDAGFSLVLCGLGLLGLASLRNKK